MPVSIKQINSKLIGVPLNVIDISPINIVIALLS